MSLAQAVRAAPVRARFRHARAAVSGTAGRQSAGTTWEVERSSSSRGDLPAFLSSSLPLPSDRRRVGGYETQRLEQVRDELRRQNALLEVESARLDSPAHRSRSKASRSRARRKRSSSPSGADRSEALTSREALLGSERLITEEE